MENYIHNPNLSLPDSGERAVSIQTAKNTGGGGFGFTELTPQEQFSHKAPSPGIDGMSLETHNYYCNEELALQMEHLTSEYPMIYKKNDTVQRIIVDYDENDDMEIAAAKIKHNQEVKQKMQDVLDSIDESQLPATFDIGPIFGEMNITDDEGNERDSLPETVEVEPEFGPIEISYEKPNDKPVKTSSSDPWEEEGPTSVASDWEIDAVMNRGPKRGLEEYREQRKKAVKAKEQSRPVLKPEVPAHNVDPDCEVELAPQPKNKAKTKMLQPKVHLDKSPGAWLRVMREVFKMAQLHDRDLAYINHPGDEAAATYIEKKVEHIKALVPKKTLIDDKETRRQQRSNMVAKAQANTGQNKRQFSAVFDSEQDRSVYLREVDRWLETMPKNIATLSIAFKTESDVRAKIIKHVRHNTGIAKIIDENGNLDRNMEQPESVSDHTWNWFTAQPLDAVEAFWSISQKAWNKLIHALIGNIDYQSSDMSFRTSFTLVPNTNFHALIYTNDTSSTIRWKQAKVSFSGVGVGLPTAPATYATMMQVVRNFPVNNPLDLPFTGILVSTNTRRYYSPRSHVVTTSSFGVSVQNDNTEYSNVVVNPGDSVFLTVFLNITPGLLSSAFQLYANFYNANFRPFALSRPKPIEITACKMAFIARAIDDYIVDNGYSEALAEMHNVLMHAYNGNLDMEAQGQPPAIELNATEQQQKVPSTSPAKKDEASAPAVPFATKMETAFGNALKGAYDTRLGGTTTSIASVLKSYAIYNTPDSYFQRNAAVQIFSKFYEQYFATSMTEHGDAGNQQARIATGYTVIEPSLPSYTSTVTLDPSWAKLSEAITTNEVIAFSQYIRINTSVANGDAMARVLAESVKKYKAGQVGSHSAVCLRLLLSMYQLYPLLGVENSGIANCHPLLDIDTAPSPSSATYPHIIPGVTNVYARIIDMNTFTALRAGIATSVLAPPEWAPNRWGDTVAIVPVTYDMNNQSVNLVAWMDGWTEYPRVTHVWRCWTTDDNGVQQTVAPSLHLSKAATTRVKGPAGRVLFVICSSFVAPNAQVQYFVGTPGLQVAINPDTNGLSGNDIDILPGLNSWNTLAAGQKASAYYQAYSWWLRFFGNQRDHDLAFFMAADHAHCIPPQPVSIANDNDLFGAFYSIRNAGAAPGWNTQGFSAQSSLSTVASIIRSATTPTGQRLYPYSETVDNNRCAMSYMPAIDYVAACDAMWGVFSKGTVTNPANSITSVISRIRHMAGIITPYVDYVHNVFGLSWSDVHNYNYSQSASAASVRVQVSSIYKTIRHRLLELHGITGWIFRPETMMGRDAPCFSGEGGVLVYMPPRDLTLICFNRVPLVALASFIDSSELPIPTSALIPKLDTEYVVNRYANDTLIEYTRYSPPDPRTDSSITMSSILSTFCFSAIDNNIAMSRQNPGLIVSNATATLSIDIGYMKWTPSSSVALWRQLQRALDPDYRLTLPPVDVPMHPVLPKFSAHYNLRVYPAFESTSIFFGKLTRAVMYNYNMILPVLTTIPANSIEASDNNGLDYSKDGLVLGDFR